MENNILSLFSGGGFLDIGFLNTGFRIEEAVEFNPYFVDCYNFGIGSWAKCNELESSHNEIIRPVDVSAIFEQERLKKTYNQVTGVIGGPPCQDFSIGGSNKGVNGDRGKLIFSYWQIVDNIKPKFILFENVEGLVRTKQHREGFDQLVQKLKESGYTPWIKILNALEYGVPQDRPRVVLVGFRADIVEKMLENGFILESGKPNSVFNFPSPYFDNPKTIKWPKQWEFGSDIIKAEIRCIPKKYKQLSVSNAFKGLNEDVANQMEHFNPISKKFTEIREGDTNRKSFKRLHRFRYSPTVAYGNNEVHLHPTLPRRLSIREALRIQSVPDEYVLPNEVSLTQKFKLISNGVPVKLSELISAEIKRTISLHSQL